MFKQVWQLKHIPVNSVSSAQYVMKMILDMENWPEEIGP